MDTNAHEKRRKCLILHGSNNADGLDLYDAICYNKRFYGLSIFANGVDRTGLELFFTEFYLFWGTGLFLDIGIAVFIFGKKVGGPSVTDVASNAALSPHRHRGQCNTSYREYF